jgi:hypothetical protein
MTCGEFRILNPGLLCFHGHSRFVPAVFNTPTVVADFVAAANLPAFGFEAPTCNRLTSFPELCILKCRYPLFSCTFPVRSSSF